MLTREPFADLADPSYDTDGPDSPLARLILALDRLFKVGPYYPPGHAATQRVTSDFRNLVKHLLGDEPALEFRIRQGGLHVQDQPLDDAWPGVADFREMLVLLGIDELQIDVDATVDDLLAFVARFLAFRNEVAATKHFQQMHYDGLPPTIRVGAKRFRTGIAIGSTAPAGDPGKPSIHDRQGPGLLVDEEAEARIASTREVAKEVEKEVEKGGDPDPPQRTVAAPPKLAENKKPVASGIGELISGLRSGEDRNIRSRALESVELMIRKLGRQKRSSGHADFLGTETESAARRQERTFSSSPEKPAEPQPKKERPQEVFQLSLPELREALVEYTDRADDFACEDEDDDTEYLSIMLQLLVDKQPPEVLTSIDRKLAVVLKKKLQANERETLVNGVLTILAGAEPQPLYKGMSLILRAFRRAPTESVIRLLDDVCADCERDELDTLWPFLVNELLLGNDTDDRACYMRLAARAGSVDVDVMRTHAQTLRKLPALKKGSFSDEVVQPPLVELFPVFSVLLEAAHPGKIAVELVRGLKLDPPGTVGDAVLPMIESYRHGYREFLVTLLAADPTVEPGPDLLEAAGRVLATDLLEIHPRRRGEDWVPETIAALALIPVPGAKKILKTIVGRRFLFLINTWPAACRKAAADARKKIELAELAAQAAREADDDPERAFARLETESDS